MLTKRPERARQVLRDAGFWDEANAYAGDHVMQRVDPLNRRRDDARATLVDYGVDRPPPNVWLGVSVEDQARDDRILILQQTPAAVRWISAEPLLWALNLRKIDVGFGPYIDALGGHEWPNLDWVVAGGESGPGARPIYASWVRMLRDDCRDAGVPFFFKQWGDWHPRGQLLADGTPNLAGIDKLKSCGDAVSSLVGKRAAGRLLDGVTHDAMPSARK